MIKIGLLRFLARTPFAKMIEVDMKMEERKKDREVLEMGNRDPWNFWVFRVGVDGTYNAEQVYKNLNGSGYITANRVTEHSRIYFGASGGYNRATYTYEDNGNLVNLKILNSNHEVAHSLVKSLKRHWGVGYRASFNNNTFENNQQRVYLKTGIEYSIFPYNEVNTRLFTISYAFDARHNTYYDTTVYLKNKETLYGQVAQASLSLNKRWGNLTSTLRYSSYLHNLQLNNLSLKINVNVRITGGLSFYFWADGSLVSDQVYLVKEKASEQEVLTRSRQIKTDYTLFSGFGLNYRFGSKLNNFINPRMEGW